MNLLPSRLKMPQWIKIENDIITDIHRSETEQPGMIKINYDCIVKIGDPVNWYDQDFYRIPDEKLAEAGIRIDNRGAYYDTKDYRGVFNITRLDVLPPAGFTKIKPIEGEPCKWENGKWVIDEEEKERINNLLTLDEVKDFVSGFVLGANT